MECSNFELVGDFMESMEQDVLIRPSFPEDSVQKLRLDLIEEELEELQYAIDNQNMVDTADALTDLERCLNLTHTSHLISKLY